MVKPIFPASAGFISVCKPLGSFLLSFLFFFFFFFFFLFSDGEVVTYLFVCLRSVWIYVSLCLFCVFYFLATSVLLILRGNANNSLFLRFFRVF